MVKVISPARIWREKKAHYMLMGVKCKKCGAVLYPPRPACSKCGSRDLEQVPLPREGILITYAVLHDPPHGFREYAPLIVGIVELTNGVKVLASLTDVYPEEVKVGMEVEAVLRRVHDQGSYGPIAYALKFRPKLKRSH